MMHTALNGWGYTQQYYTYEPVQADGILATYLTKLSQRSLTPTEAMAEAARQVNALEATGQASAAAIRKTLASEEAFIARAKAATGAVATPPPPLVDAGTAPAKLPTALAVNRTASSCTLSGTTAGPGNPGLHGGSTGAVFAGSAFQSSRGTFTARLTGLVAPPGVSLSGAKVGLMAASSLGSGAATVYVAVTTGVPGQHYPQFAGIHFGYRGVVNAGNMFDRGIAGDTVGAGLLPGAAFEVLTATGTGHNLLKRPIWLRLTLDDVTWSAYTSLDGATWSPAGSPTGVIGIGWWVGLVVAAPHATKPIRATFDQVSGFVPTQEVVRIGPVAA